MSIAKGAVVIAAIALLGAGIVAVLARDPGEMGRRHGGRELTDPSLGSDFTEAQVARHGAFRLPLYAGIAAGVIIEVVVLVVLARGPWHRLFDAIEGLPGGWPSHAAAAGISLSLVLALAALPLGFVTGFAIPKAWGLSTQTPAGWAADAGRSLGIGAVVAAISAAAFYGVLRLQPRLWWVTGWLVFTGLTVLMTFLWPVAVAPLFNKFTPLEDGELRDRLVALARAARVDVDEVLVTDASRRTTAENAYVAGFGASKRLVLYDTLVDAGSDDETAFIVAHELGHRVHRHIGLNVAIASAGLLGGFALLAFLAGREWLWSWTGAAGIGDIRGAPALLLVVVALTLATMPLQNAISRHFETQADVTAIELTHDPDPAVSVFRRLAFSNIADLRPPSIAVVTLFSHPPLPERIERVESIAEPLPSP